MPTIPHVRAAAFVLVASFASVFVADAVAQDPTKFGSLDADADGFLSRSEFSQQPGFAGSPEAFAYIDKNHDRVLSRDEWLIASQEALGVAALVTSASPEPGLLRHPSSLPKLAAEERTSKPLLADYQKFLTGRAGVQQTPPPPQRKPSPPPAIPTEVRPPR